MNSGPENFRRRTLWLYLSLLTRILTLKCFTFRFTLQLRKECALIHSLFKMHYGRRREVGLKWSLMDQRDLWTRYQEAEKGYWEKLTLIEAKIIIRTVCFTLQITSINCWSWNTRTSQCRLNDSNLIHLLGKLGRMLHTSWPRTWTRWEKPIKQSLAIPKSLEIDISKRVT